ncbi:MAG: hypothetical protein FJX71_01160 [Alphaproteobacteria bacterium]|nr:hypothetical protein [Alphaproteobacteria bacterium]
MDLIVRLNTFLLACVILFFSNIGSLQASDDTSGSIGSESELEKAFRKRRQSQGLPSALVTSASAVVGAAIYPAPSAQEPSSPQLSESPPRGDALVDSGAEEKKPSILELIRSLQQSGLAIAALSELAPSENAEQGSDVQPLGSSNSEKAPHLYELHELLTVKERWGIDLDRVRERQEALALRSEEEMRGDISVEILNLMTRKERLLYEIPAIRNQIDSLKKKRELERQKLEKKDEPKKKKMPPEEKKRIEALIVQLTTAKNETKQYLLSHSHLNELHVLEELRVIQDKILKEFPTLRRAQLVIIPAKREWENLKKELRQGTSGGPKASDDAKE